MPENDKKRPVPRRRIKKPGRKRKRPARYGSASGRPQDAKEKSKTEVVELPTFDRFYPLDLLDVSPGSRPDMIQRVLESDAIDVRCPYHPDTSATGKCKKCHRPVCPQCSLKRQFLGTRARTPQVCMNCQASRLSKISVISLIAPTLLLFAIFMKFITIPRAYLPILAAGLVLWFTVFFWLIFSLHVKISTGFRRLSPRQLAEWWIYKGKPKKAHKVLDAARDEQGAEILRRKVIASTGYGSPFRSKRDK